MFDKDYRYSIGGIRITWKSGRLLAISAKMQPIDQMSTGHEYLLAPRRISGARYQRVTTSWV